MRPRDEEVFRKTAKKFHAWILVRESNNASLEYVGNRIYQSKPISCKPKTATNPVNEPGKKIMGLVADPVRWPEAFIDRSDEALALWSDFRRIHRLGEFQRQPSGGFAFVGDRNSSAGYAIDAEVGSKHEGCLTFEGKYIYGDYDLFGIGGDATPEQVSKVAVGPKNAPKLQTVDYRGARWGEISTFLNSQLGFTLIQHGAQFDWKKEFEAVKAFGPNGETQTWDAAETARKYSEWNRTSV